jgi:hypothetical protein
MRRRDVRRISAVDAARPYSEWRLVRSVRYWRLRPPRLPLLCSASAVQFATSACDIESSSFLRSASFNHARAAMEDDMAVDAVLWLILAGMIGWIVLGCQLTAPHRDPTARSRH